MTTKAFVVFGVLLSCVFTGCDEAKNSPTGPSSNPKTAPGGESDTEKPGSDATSSESSSPSSATEAQSAAQPSSSVVYLHETFDSYEIDAVPSVPELQRAAKVTVFDAGEKPLPGKVARFNDSDDEAGGAMEYAVGTGGSSNLYIEFDALNNDPEKGDKNSVVIFGVGPWSEGKSLVLNSKSKRAFGLEFFQQKHIKLRVGDGVVAQVKYDPATAINTKIWINDHDTNTLSYKRPDNGEQVTLNADSVVVWQNDVLFGELDAAGTPMHSDVTQGDRVVGRIGLSSSSTKVADFLFDNLHVEDPSGATASDEKSPAKDNSAKTNDNAEATPAKLPGAESFSYRDGENPMNLFVFKPKDWQADDNRSALIYFFGGGWTKGTPAKSAGMARWAAENGMVGIAPDYRTKNRFQTGPQASVDDGRAAFNWVLEHASEMGIDPNRIAVGGNSAGGHVAMWTAIEKAPPGSNPATSPKTKPAALFLKSAVTDTSKETGYTPSRFGDDATALSPVHQLDANMPPTMIFHAAFDELVHYRTAVALHNRLESTGNKCDLVTVPVGGHGFTSQYKEWNTKLQTKLVAMFNREGLLPAAK